MSYRNSGITLVLCVAAFVGLATCCVASASVDGGPPDHALWELTFEDHFDGDTLDARVWNVQASASPHLLSGRWPENVVVEDGLLRLVTRKELRAGQEWTTGHIWTRNFKQQYGYFEARMRYAAATGVNNAFWLFEPGVLEIDIVEGQYPDIITTNLHYRSETGEMDRIQSISYRSTVDLSDGFHVYAVEWNEDEVVWYFDGEVIRRWENTVAHHPLDVRFSTAVVQDWRGPVTDALDGTSMDVDWVRVYQRRNLLAIEAPEDGVTVSGQLPVRVRFDDHGRFALDWLTLMLDDRELFAGSGVPDAFTIDTTRLDDGPHTLTVVGRVDGRHTYRAKATFTVDNIQVALDEGPVTGPWAGQVDLRVRVDEGTDEISWVRITLGDRTVYQGAKLPAGHSVDTLAFEDGEYHLSISITRTDQNVIRKRLPVTIQNWHALVDELRSPVTSLLGTIDYTLTSSRSSGWRYDTGRASEFFGDVDRLVRTGNSEEYLVWHLANLRVATFTLYAKDPAINDTLAIWVSDDGDTWHAARYKATTLGVSSAGWHALQVEAEIPASLDAQYIKLMLRETDDPFAEVQVGAAELKGVLRP